MNQSMASSSAVVPYGSTSSSGLGNTQKSNLQITFNMGAKYNCKKCKKTIKDYFCFCNECRKYLHPKCAGVKIQTGLCDRDGSKYIKLPSLEDLPLCCPDCMERKSRNNNQGSSETTLVPSSSITRFLESSNKSAHELVPGHGNFQIHKNALGHELELKDYGDVYTCSACKEKGFGCHHACRNKSCTFRLHEECKSPRLTLSHSFFPGLRFDFRSKPNFINCTVCETKHSYRSCSACGMYVNGYFYRSQDDKHHLHPCCANLSQQIKCRNTGATMKLQHKTTSKCFYCGKTEVKRGIKHTTKAWSYVSESGNIRLHVTCIKSMLSELKDELGDNNHSRLLTLHKNVSNGVPEINLQIAARADTQRKWEQRFKTFMKYAKIVLGAIISAFLGDPTALLTSFIVAWKNPDN